MAMEQLEAALLASLSPDQDMLTAAAAELAQ